MFYGKFADKGDNPVNSINIYDVEGDNRLLPSLQHLTTGSALENFELFEIWLKMSNGLGKIGNSVS